MTLTEQKLCRMWHEAETTGEWWELYQKLQDIGQVLMLNGNVEMALLFHDAGKLALLRRVDKIREAA